MTTLDFLPNELIEGILDHLSLPSLLNVSLTNRHLRDLTVGHIYTTFPGRNPAFFLRTVTEGRLAKYVKNVTWTLDLPVKTRGFSPPRPVKRNLAPAERHRIAEAFRSLEAVSPQSAMDQDLATRFDTKENSYVHKLDHWFLEFFLLFLPNVESLLVHDAWYWNDHTYWFTHVVANADRFEHLKSVTMTGPLRIENIVPLFTLAALRNLELWQVTVMRRASDEEFAWNMPDHTISDMLRNVSSNLETLALRESHIPTTSFVPVLAAIQDLKSFTYDQVENDLFDEPDWDKEMDYNVLATALSSHVIETLSIHTHYVPPIRTFFPTLLAPLPSLKNFAIGTFHIHSTSETEAHRYADDIAHVLPGDIRTFEIKFDFDSDSLHDRGVMDNSAFKVCFVKALARATRRTQLRELVVQSASAMLGREAREALELEMGLEGLAMRFREVEVEF